MSLFRAILVLITCIVVQAARMKINSDSEILERDEQDELLETHPPKETCSEFDAEVKRLNVSVPVGLALDVLCAEWPVDKWGPFPNMNTTKAIEEFLTDSKNYYDKFKALAHTIDKKFCWKHLGYAEKIADAVECPATFHPKQLGVHELETSTDIKPNLLGYCTKSCDQMCGPDAKQSALFWCKCQINGTTVTVPKSVRRNWVKCPKKFGDDPVMKWGTKCFAACPAGTHRLNKRMPFCDTDCHVHSEFNTSCGWGCAQDKRYCADSTEKMTLYGIAAAVDVVAVATGQLEAIPMIYTLVGLVDTLYGIIEKVVLAVRSEYKRVKGLPFLAAASKWVVDILKDAKDVKHTVEETQGLVKKIVVIIKDLYDLTGHDAKVPSVLTLTKLFGKFHLKVFVAAYDTFKAFHKPLCPYSTDTPLMEGTVNYDGVAPKANIE